MIECCTPIGSSEVAEHITLNQGGCAGMAAEVRCLTRTGRYLRLWPRQMAPCP
jgi:hypothetical protein